MPSIAYCRLHICPRERQLLRMLGDSSQSLWWLQAQAGRKALQNLNYLGQFPIAFFGLRAPSLGSMLAADLLFLT